MPHFVKITPDGYLREFWDSPPPVPVGTDGWKNAIVEIPEIDSEKEYLGDFVFDLESDPVVASKPILIYTVDQRKQNLLYKNTSDFNYILDSVQKSPYLLTAEEIHSYRNKASNNKVKIQNCISHEDLNVLVLESLSII